MERRLKTYSRVDENTMTQNSPIPLGAKLEWKVLEVDDAKSIKVLEEALNDEWIITQSHGAIFICARVIKNTISPIL